MVSFYKNLSEEKGFTLIELSIVLVIIGLIVGGILTGQDLIKAAEQRATIAQIEKYNTAVNTFRNKFGGIPGDLSYASATSFSLLNSIAVTNGGNPGLGDGNGLVEGGTAGATLLLGETVMFWLELSQAGLIDGSYGSTMTTGAAIVAATTVAGVNAFVPPTKLGRGNSITTAEVSGINYYVIGGFTTIPATGVYDATGKNTNNLNAIESYAMDKKVDDGLPQSGSVQVMDITAGFAPGTTNTTVAACNSATAYTVNPGTTPGCSLRFRFN